MFKKLIFIGLISLSLGALSLRDAEAQWAISLQPPFQITNTVTGFIHAQSQGSIFNGKTDFSLTVPEAAPGGFNGVLVCGNPGKKGNQSPGIQLALVNQAEAFSNSQLIKNHGTSADLTITASLSDQDLQELADRFCPNGNWFGVDYAPCTTTTTVTLFDSKGVQQDQTIWSCQVPSCETLGFDPNTLKFEQRAYSCTQVQ